MNERVGTELSASARQVIADARGADDPSAEDEARVKARWLAGIAAGAGVSSLSEAVRAAASTGWGLKAGALAAALAAATAGVYLGWPQLSGSSGPDAPPAPAVSAPLPAPAAPPAPAPPPGGGLAPAAAPVVPAPASAAAPAEPEAAPPEEAALPPTSAPAEAEAASERTEPAAPHSAALPRARVTAARKAPAPAPTRKVEQVVAARPVANAPTVASGQLGEEIALLSQIRGQLQAGDPSRALAQLAEYRRRFEQPNLAMEADALRVDALCQGGEREAARAAAALFATNWPASPLQQRVSAACP